MGTNIIHTVFLDQLDTERPRVWLDTDEEDAIMLHLFKIDYGEPIGSAIGPLTLEELQAVQKCVNEAVAKLLKQNVEGYKGD